MSLGQASQKLHVPYAIRFMARLQEQAAQSSESDIKSADLEAEASQMRVALKALDQDPILPAEISGDLPQKIKLLNWLRQSR